MSLEGEQALSTNCKWRGIIRASLTRLDARLAKLEAKAELSMSDRLAAQWLLQKLDFEC